MAFDQAAKANPAAAALVQACAFLAPDAIAEEIFTRGGKALGEPLVQATEKPLLWDAAVADAGRFALIRRNADNETINIHRLVQEVVRDRMDAKAHSVWAERVVEALNEVFPYVRFHNWSQCERLIPHAIAAGRLAEDLKLCSASAARLANQSGWYLSKRARYGDAEPLCQRAVAMREKVFGAEHPNVAQSLNNLALLYHRQSRHAEAGPLYGRALAIRERTVGPDHIETAESLNNLALLYYKEGRYAEAEPLCERALAIREKRDNDQAYTATSLNILAAIYSGQGRSAEAEPLLHRALAIRENVLAPGHPDTAHSLNDLALLYEKQGRYAEAEPLYERALAVREKALGSEHPLCVVSLLNYAKYLRNVGRPEEAEQLETQVKVSAQLSSRVKN